MAPDAVADHGHVLTAPGESADDVDRLGECRVVGVDGLRDDAEAHAQCAPAIVSSTSARSSAAKRSGVECHAS